MTKSTGAIAFLTPGLARRIRLAHLVERKSMSACSRDHRISLSAVSRLVRWQTWTNQDHDLRGISRPTITHGKPLTPAERAAVEAAKLNKGRTCRSCVHFREEQLDCGLGFPECLESHHHEARWCAAYIEQQVKAPAAATA